VPKIDDRGRTLCVFYLYGDAEGIATVSFRVKGVRSITIAVPNGNDSDNVQELNLGRSWIVSICFMATRLLIQN
jgi:hypothetical protein